MKADEIPHPPQPFARKHKKRVVVPGVVLPAPVVGTVKPNKYKHIENPETGTLDWGLFPEIEAQGMTFPAGPIRLTYGEHLGPKRGFGLEHIWEAHFKGSGASPALPDIIADVAVFLKGIIRRGTEIYYEGGLGSAGNRPMLFKTKAGVVVIEMREDRRSGGCFYSIVTAFPATKAQGYVIGTL